MKILVINDSDVPARESINLWRFVRPFRELHKHVDWQVDYAPFLVDYKLLDETYQVPVENIVQVVEQLGQYDIVWSGYFPDEVMMDIMTFTQQKYGTKFVMDIDDDFWHIQPENPFWKRPNASNEQKATQYAILEAPYLVTSVDNLHEFYSAKRPGKPTYTFGNYIGGYNHRPFDNGDNVVVAFAGSVSHIKDIEKVGFIAALQRIMKRYPYVYAGSAGLKFPGMTGTLKKRYSFFPGLSGQAYLDDVWPKMNADICVAPLQDNEFNRRKTNIKWLETALIPAAFIGSNMPPYAGTVEDGVTGLLVDDGEDNWFAALERLVTDSVLRRAIRDNGTKEVKKAWMLSDNWPKLKSIIEAIHADNSYTKRRPLILTPGN